MMDQRSPEWFAARLGRVTASRVEDVMARTKGGDEAAARKNYRADLVVERLTGQQAGDGFISAPMQRGIDKEPDARAWYVGQTGNLVTQLGFVVHPEHPWVGCSPDSEVEEGVGGLEIKCPNTATHIETLLNGTMKYKAQVQFQMWVMGWQWVDFVSFDDRMPAEMHGRILRVERDQKYIDGMAAEVVKFLDEVQGAVDRLREQFKEAA